jgi:hypothetical protein
MEVGNRTTVRFDCRQNILYGEKFKFTDPKGTSNGQGIDFIKILKSSTHNASYEIESSE